MADTEMIKKVIVRGNARAAVEAAKAAVLAISGEDRRQNINAEQHITSEVTIHRMGSSVRHLVFNWNAKRNV